MEKIKVIMMSILMMLVSSVAFAQEILSEVQLLTIVENLL